LVGHGNPWAFVDVPRQRQRQRQRQRRTPGVSLPRAGAAGGQPPPGHAV